MYEFETEFEIDSNNIKYLFENKRIAEKLFLQITGRT